MNQDLSNMSVNIVYRFILFDKRGNQIPEDRILDSIVACKNITESIISIYDAYIFIVQKSDHLKRDQTYLNSFYHDLELAVEGFEQNRIGLFTDRDRAIDCAQHIAKMFNETKRKLEVIRKNINKHRNLMTPKMYEKFSRHL